LRGLLLLAVGVAAVSCHDQPTAPAASRIAPELPRLASELSGTTPEVSGGEGFTCAVKTDGAVICWGQIAIYAIPSGLTSATQISSGGTHACALQSSNIICWGGNSFDELNTPAGIGPVAQVVAGYLHTCAVRSEGTVACWGDNSLGQTNSPPNLASVFQISSDASHTCAVSLNAAPPPQTPTGTVACWGDNRFGQSSVPSGLPSVSQVSAGGYHTCALTSDRTVICWGANGNGQSTVPDGLSYVAQLTSGYYFSCALKADATVLCWGDNSRGQTNVPAGLSSVRQVGSGGYHTCAVKTDGTVVCWGDSQYGGTSLPDGLNLIVSQPQVITFTSTPPAPVTVGETYSLAATGGESGNVIAFTSLTPSVCTVQDAVVSLVSSGTCTIAADQAGNASYLPAPREEQSFFVMSPLPFPAVSPQLDASDNHTCALNATGRVTCWGFDGYGQATPPSNLPPMVRVVAGGYHSCGLQANGQIICWGHDGYGQSTPPAGLTAVAIGAGTHHTCAVKTSGGVVCWGRDSEGQSDVPSGLASVVQVDGSAIHSCALKGDGALLCWGSNAQGQLNVPAGVVFKQVTTGGLTTCALKSETTVACWGYNGGGQAEVPDGLTDVNQVSSGGHNCALRRDASVLCWSYNSNGQLNVPAGLRALIVTAGGYHTCALATDGSVLCWGDSGFNKTAVPRGLNLLGEQTQTIIFTSVPPSPAPVGAIYQAVATGGGSGNPVVFTTLTPAICGADPSGVVTTVGAGTCTVEANQAGIGDYLAATNAQQSFAVMIPNRPPVPNAGGPYSGNEGSPVLFDGRLSSDPEGNSLTYSWDFGDGTHAVGVTPTHSYKDNGSYSVSLTVNDGQLNSTVATSPVTIANVAPTAAFLFPSAVNESYTLAVSAISLSLISGTDPSSADTQAGLRFAFVCSGNFGQISYATATTANAALCPAYDGPSTTTAKARVFDKDGGWTEYTSSQITINNVAPTINITGPWCDCLAASFSISINDAAGELDRVVNTGFPGSIDWGDKTPAANFVKSFTGVTSAGHTYMRGGSYTMVAVVSDKDGGRGTATVSFTLTQPVTIYISPTTVTKATKTLSVGVAGTAVVNAGLISQESLLLGRTPVARDARGNLQCGTKTNTTTGFTDLGCQFDVAELRANGDLTGTGLRTLFLTGSIPSDGRKIRGDGQVTLK
jgi:alpha-tubulin suppressor-like RCC1 family protein